jgi:cytochrome c biogenesis protein CcdA/glutaredoxin
MVLLSAAFAAAVSAPIHGSRSIAHPSPSWFPAFDVSPTGSASDKIPIYFFYGNGCPHCALVEPLIDSLCSKYPQTDFQRLEVYYNSANQALSAQFNARFGIQEPLVPTVFIGDKVLIGDDEIKAKLEPEIQRIISANTPPPGDTNTTPPTEPPADNSTTPPITPPSDNSTVNPPLNNNTTAGGVIPYKKLTIGMVVIAAIADSINPCAISVMIFLLIFLTGLGNKRKVFLVGATYIVTAFLTYFMAGLGALTFLQSMAMTRYVYYLAAVLSITFGLVNLKDYFSNKSGPTLAIPESRKPMIKRYIEKASIPAAVVLGFSVSLFELPCTGGIYLAILSLLSSNMTMAEGIPYLALYNAIFVLPLIGILVVFIKGVSAEKANSWRLENRKVLRLGMGLVMLLLGAVMLLGAL